jgi:hypothetical protein
MVIRTGDVISVVSIGFGLFKGGWGGAEVRRAESLKPGTAEVRDAERVVQRCCVVREREMGDAG